MVVRTSTSVPQRRQPRMGARLNTGSHVNQSGPSRGSCTPRTRRPSHGRPTARDTRQRMGGYSGSADRASGGGGGPIRPVGSSGDTTASTARTTASAATPVRLDAGPARLALLGEGTDALEEV